MGQLEELRKIIVGDNSAQLSELKRRVESLDARTRDVAEVLAPAIDQGILANDDLIIALKEPVSEGLKQAIRAEPIEYANILYPAIAPSIRLAISQAISSLLATINQTIKSTTSVSGIKTRLESLRTGVPYAELVFRQSLLYRVEHLYLIERESGLLICERSSESSDSLDSDAVSAMFSAIQSFVQDSFSGKQSDRLTDFKVGPYTVWLAHGPRAMLACVIFGDAPETLKTQLYDTLDGIRTRYANQLANYDGDNADFSGVEDLMDPLLQVRLKNGDTNKYEAAKGSAGFTFFLLALFAACVYWVALQYDKQSKLSTVQYYLENTPGFVINSIQWRNNRVVVHGLQDPDALLPIQILKAYDIDNLNLRLQTTAFRSLHPVLETRRFEEQLQPPAGVEISQAGRQMVIRGKASIQWLLENDTRLRQLSADGRLQMSGLRVLPSSIAGYFESSTEGSKKYLDTGLLAAIRNQPWIELSGEQIMKARLQL